MPATCYPLAMLCCLALVPLAGCQLVPQSRLTAAEANARALTEQNRALLAEIENREAHTRHLEERVRRAEEDLALLEGELGVDRRRLSHYENEREELKRRVGSLATSGGRLGPGASLRLADLADRHPSLIFDPQTGIAKLDADILFDTSDDRIHHEGEKVLQDFAQMFQETDARDLKIMIVGHTDDRGVAKKPTRERFANNWQLSTDRALVVANYLRKSGVPEDRMGIAGFAGYQPIASSEDEEGRQRNRRVEIFLMGPETPVVGWTESTTNVYR